MLIQAFCTESTVKRLDKCVVGRLSRPREVEHHLVLIRPKVEITRDELRALIDVDRFRQANLLADTFQRSDDFLAAIAEPRIDHRREPRKDINYRQDAPLAAQRQRLDPAHGFASVATGFGMLIRL